MGPEGSRDAFTSTRPPRFGDPTKEDYPSYRRDVELWLKLTDVALAKQGVALVGCLSGEPKEFVKTMSDQLLFSDQSGVNVLQHLDKAYQNSTEMILNGRVSAFLDYQRLPSMSISTYIAGFYARLDNLAQLQMPDELKGHLLLKQANLEKSEKSMVVASAQGSYKVGDLVDFMTKEKKKFCTYCRKKNHVEADCWKKRKEVESQNSTGPSTGEIKKGSRSTYVSFISMQSVIAEQSALVDSGAVFSVIGMSTLDDIMRAYGIKGVEKCQPLSVVHKFGTNGTPIETEFGAIIPWVVQDNKGKEHGFNLRIDVLRGDYPLLIGCPTLVAMEAVLYFAELKLSATINGTRCELPLRKSGNHIFMDYAFKARQTTNATFPLEPSRVDYYKLPTGEEVQFFRRPGHC
jgi:hypothetical protein